MSYLILVAGLPGTGKTLFARYLSKKISIPMVSKDLLKECLFDTVGFKSRQEKMALGVAACGIMYHVADLHLEIGQPVILENNFENASKPGLCRLIEKHTCKTVTVKFFAEANVLAKRFMLRDKSPERHRGHVINTQYPEPEGAGDIKPEPFNPDIYFSAMKERGMDIFSIGGEEILVDTTDFSFVCYDTIRSKIEAAIKRLDL
jgi:predicted kinase